MPLALSRIEQCQAKSILEEIICRDHYAGSGKFWWSLLFAAQKRVLGSSRDSIPPHFTTALKSVAPPTGPFKSGTCHACALAVDFGGLITKIYQSRKLHALEHTSVRLWASKVRFLIADHVSCTQLSTLIHVPVTYQPRHVYGLRRDAPLV